MDDTQPLTLRDVAIAASTRVGGLRGRELGRQAEKRGLTLSYTTVDKIIAGTYTSRPKPQTLDALSELSGISRARVYDAAGVPMPLSPLAEQLPPDADLLSPEQRRTVIAVVREFARMQRLLHGQGQRQEGEGDDRDAATTKPAGGSPAPETGRRLPNGVLLVDPDRTLFIDATTLPPRLHDQLLEHQQEEQPRVLSEGQRAGHGRAGVVPVQADVVLMEEDGTVVVLEMKTMSGPLREQATRYNVAQVFEYGSFARAKVDTAGAEPDGGSLDQEQMQWDRNAAALQSGRGRRLTDQEVADTIGPRPSGTASGEVSAVIEGDVAGHHGKSRRRHA